jgi:hypothetical protein
MVGGYPTFHWIAQISLHEMAIGLVYVENNTYNGCVDKKERILIR